MASFLLGNIKPDLSSKYLNIPHYKKDSEEIIEFCYNKNIVTNHNASSICSYIDDLYKKRAIAHRFAKQTLVLA